MYQYFIFHIFQTSKVLNYILPHTNQSPGLFFLEPYKNTPLLVLW